MLMRPVRRALRPLFEHEQLLMISISTVVVMAGQGVIAPVLPLFAETFGVGTVAIGLTLSFFALARLILNIPMGILSDRYGRRLLLVLGPIITGLSMIGSGLSGSIGELLVWRFLAGAGSAMYMTGAQIYLTDISTPANRATFIGTNQGALLLGVSVGPAIGGLLAELGGYRLPFYAVGIASPLAALYAYLRLPETKHLSVVVPPPVVAGARRPWVQFVRSRDFLAVAWVTLMVFFTRTASQHTLMPLMALAWFGMGAGQIGILFTIMSVINMVLIPPAAMIADRLGRKAAIVPSGLLTSVALVMLAFSTNVAMFYAGAIVLAFAVSIAGPAPIAYAADIAPPHLRGLAMGLYRTAGDIGFLTGPIILGLIADRTSYAWALNVNAAVFVGASLFFLTARETIKRQPRQVAEAT